MTRNNLQWQTDANGLLIVEYPDLVVVHDEATGRASNGGIAVLLDLGFEVVPSGLAVSAKPSGAELRLSEAGAEFVLRLSDGSATRDSLTTEHPEWTNAVRELGYAPVLVSLGGGLLPGATTERLARHADAGDLLGGLVRVVP